MHPKQITVALIVIGILLGMGAGFLALSALSKSAEKHRLADETLMSLSAQFTAEDGTTESLIAEDIVHGSGTLSFGVTTLSLLTGGVMQVHATSSDALTELPIDATLTEGSLFVGSPVIGRDIAISTGTVTARTLGGGFLIEAAPDAVTISVAYGAVEAGFTDTNHSTILTSGQSLTLTAHQLLTLESTSEAFPRALLFANATLPIASDTQMRVMSPLLSKDAWRISQEISRVLALTRTSESGLLSIAKSFVALTGAAKQSLSGDLLFASLAGIENGTLETITVDDASLDLLKAIEPLTRLMPFEGITSEQKTIIAHLEKSGSTIRSSLASSTAPEAAFKNALLGKPLPEKYSALTEELFTATLIAQSIREKETDIETIKPFYATLSESGQAAFLARLLTIAQAKDSAELMRSYTAAIALLPLSPLLPGRSAAIIQADFLQTATVYSITRSAIPTFTEVTAFQEETGFVPKSLWQIAPDGSLYEPQIQALPTTEASEIAEEAELETAVEAPEATTVAPEVAPITEPVVEEPLPTEPKIRAPVRTPAPASEQKVPRSKAAKEKALSGLPQ